MVGVQQRLGLLEHPQGGRDLDIGDGLQRPRPLGDEAIQMRDTRQTTEVIIRGGEHGWTAARAVAALVAGAVSSAVFAVIEYRTAAPIFPLTLLRNGEFGATLSAAGGLSFAAFACSLLLSLWLQQQLRLPPLQAGLSMLPLAATAFVVSGAFGRMLHDLAPRWTIAGTRRRGRAEPGRLSRHRNGATSASAGRRIRRTALATHRGGRYPPRWPARRCGRPWRAARGRSTAHHHGPPRTRYAPAPGSQSIARAEGTGHPRPPRPWRARSNAMSPRHSRYRSRLRTHRARMPRCRLTPALAGLGNPGQQQGHSSWPPHRSAAVADAVARTGGGPSVRAGRIQHAVADLDRIGGIGRGGGRHGGGVAV